MTRAEDDDHRPVEDVPTVACERCDREWALDFELDELKVGNGAAEQFALDHRRHTGHFPDDVTPWLVDCRHCPEAGEYLREPAARRFAATHARHTGHAVALDHDSLDGTDEISR